MSEATGVLTEEQIKEKLPEWQKVLCLQDWGVKVKISRARELNGEGLLGQVKTNIEHRRAEISLLDPIDHDPVRQISYDMEETLVHELLHLHFDPFLAKDGTPELTAQEQAINAIAVALVGLSRQLQREKGIGVVMTQML